MTEYEYQTLIQELEILKILLDFHIENKERIAMSGKEFDNYVNATLDRINEIKKLLNPSTC